MSEYVTDDGRTQKSEELEGLLLGVPGLSREQYAHCVMLIWGSGIQ